AQESQFSRFRTAPEAQDHYRAEYERHLKSASETYQKVADLLGERAARAALSGEDEKMMRQTAFAAAECRYFLPGEQGKAREMYKELAKRYAGRAEELYALRGVASCYFSASDYASASLVVEQVRAALGKLDDAQFANQPDGRDRAWWEKWLTD